MPVVTHFIIKALLVLTALTVLLSAPTAFAKKDLFGSDPEDKHTNQSQQLISTPNTSEQKSDTPTTDQHTTKEAEPAANTEEKKKGFFLVVQYERLKSNILSAKNDLFGSKNSTQKAASAPTHTEKEQKNTGTNVADGMPVPTISPTDAAQRAQHFSEGQVINVRKYQDEEKPRYAVKLLQKNGRMKTLTLDATTGELIENTTQETDTN